MNASELENRISGIIVRDLEVNVSRDDILASESLEELFGLDSMAILELVLSIEKEFKIVIPVEDLTRENFRSIKSIAALVRRLT